MSNDVKIVFCTTCKNRYQHLKETIPRNLLDNTYCNTKFVVLDYSSGDDMASRIQEDHIENLNSGRLVYYKYYGDHSFRMAHAKNLAHRLGIIEGADILVNLDADNFTGPNFDEYLLSKFESIENVFMWADMIKGVLPKGISGRIVCSKNQFILSGGYDEKYETYSPDDKDYVARLVRLGFVRESIDPKYLLAIRHNDKMRFKEYPYAADSDAEDFCIDQHNRVINYGNFGCGVVKRNFCEEEIHIGPMPTRIFGIGMHKTATTSLHHALQILGFKSAHWKNAHWAKAIWAEMNSTGRSLTLERGYAVSDLPIPLLYKKLDTAYPNSKFILTIRPELDWIKSIKNHFDPKYNPQQPYWKNDPFTNIIHKETYGQRNFDAELFLSTYRKHNAEVKEYFEGRSDLLVMENSEWADLCKFLGVGVPSQDYPSRNITPCDNRT